MDRMYSAGPGSDLTKENKLTHYADVVEGRKLPNFMLARHLTVEDLTGRSVGAEEWKKTDTDDLIGLHDSCLENYPEAYRGVLEAAPDIAENSFLRLKIHLAERLSSPCRLCPNECLAERREGKTGRCGVADTRIGSEGIHLGEERELVPSHTIFFTGCNLFCVYCQNHDISTDGSKGIVVPPERMASVIDRRAAGDAPVRNTNWVGGDPTPHIAYVLETMFHLRERQTQLWNSNMYLTEKALRLLFGVTDLFLTDFKYGNDLCARRLSGVDDYVEVVGRNHEKASDHADLMVRHLVLPGHLDCCTEPIMDRLSDLSDGNVKVNVMDQYRPVYHWREGEDLGRTISHREFRRALKSARKNGLELAEGL